MSEINLSKDVALNERLTNLYRVLWALSWHNLGCSFCLFCPRAGMCVHAMHTQIRQIERGKWWKRNYLRANARVPRSTRVRNHLVSGLTLPLTPTDTDTYTETHWHWCRHWFWRLLTLILPLAPTDTDADSASWHFNVFAIFTLHRQWIMNDWNIISW